MTHALSTDPLLLAVIRFPLISGTLPVLLRNRGLARPAIMDLGNVEAP
jgi:hypothetical protein